MPALTIVCVLDLGTVPNSNGGEKPSKAPEARQKAYADLQKACKW